MKARARWIGKSRPYEALSPVAAVVDGKVIVPNSGGQSIYSDNANMLYAFDQNTGQIIWTYPGLSSATVIDDQHMLCGTTMINPDTGGFLYTIPRSIMLYVPELKMGFGNGPSPGQGAATLMAQDFSDFKGPKTVWTSAPYESVTWVGYSNDKVFFGGRNSYRIMCARASKHQLCNILVSVYPEEVGHWPALRS